MKVNPNPSGILGILLVNLTIVFVSLSCIIVGSDQICSLLNASLGKAYDNENTGPGLCQAQHMCRGETDEYDPNPLPLDNWILNDNIYTQNN